MEVTFSPAAEAARVVLTHAGWEKLSANAQRARDRYNQGWESVFVSAYRTYLQSRQSIQDK